MKNILSDEVIELFDTAAQNIEVVWRGMYEDGFTVDKQLFTKLNEIECGAPSGVESVEYFYKELIRETLTNQNKFFLKRPSGEGSNGYKSKYLDWLSEQNQPSIINLKPHPIYTQPSLTILNSSEKYKSPLSKIFLDINNIINVARDNDIQALKKNYPEHFSKNVIKNKKFHTENFSILLKQLGFEKVNLRTSELENIFTTELHKNLGYLSICFEVLSWKKNHFHTMYFAVTDKPITKCIGGNSLPPLFFTNECFSPAYSRIMSAKQIKFEVDKQNKLYVSDYYVDDDLDQYASLYLQSLIKHFHRLLSVY